MKYFVLLLILICSNAWAKVGLELVLNTDTVKQGEILNGKLIVKESQGQVAFAGLKGKKFGKTLYLMNLSPFMGKQGVLESDVKVIFIAVPEANYLLEKVNEEEIAISWNNIQVEPTEETKSFLLGDFEVPERKEFLPWILGILGIGLLIGLGLWISQKIKNKKLSKSQLAKVKEEMLNCKSYDDVVLMWRQKHGFLKTFPQLETAFKALEETLFKYQFKPHRTQYEVDEVLSAYASFKTQVSGALNGV